MTEQLISIGVESELKHVKSEIDRVDAIFTVATGPMGYQEVNYHVIDEERDRRSIRQSLTAIQPINESPKEKPSLKSRSSHPQAQRTIELIDSKVLNTSQDTRITTKDVELKISDDHNRTARFSLPEIDSFNRQENKYQIKKINKSLKSIRKEQSISKFPITTIKEEEYQEYFSPSFSHLNESSLEIPEHCRPNVNNLLQHQAESLLPFYTITELAQHNHSTDAWICIFAHIYDITSLIEKIQGTSAYQQLIDYAGQDISSWFDEQTHEPRRRIDPQTYQSVLVVENLSIIETLGSSFWKTKDLLIGQLTEHSRYIRLLHNFSPKHPYLIEVAEEETIGQIAKKCLKYNSHIFSYIWQYNGRILDFNKTLTENGIPNEESFHDQYGWQSNNENCPTILLYFSDDLTIA